MSTETSFDSGLDLTSVLERMRARTREFEEIVRNYVETENKPTSVACKDHSFVSAINWDRSVFETMRDGTGQIHLIYDVCKKCQEQARIACQSLWLRDRGVPSKLLHCMLGNWTPKTEEDKKTLEIVKKFAARKSGFLILQGKDPGIGKSHLAVGVMREKNCGHFITHSELMERLSAHYDDRKNPNPIDRCKTAKMLVLDEVGVSRGGSDEFPTLNSILRARYDEDLPTVMTTNMDIESFKGLVGIYVVDRLSEVCTVVYMRGQSRRAERRDLND